MTDHKCDITELFIHIPVITYDIITTARSMVGWLWLSAGLHNLLAWKSDVICVHIRGVRNPHCDAEVTRCLHEELLGNNIRTHFLTIHTQKIPSQNVFVVSLQMAFAKRSTAT